MYFKKSFLIVGLVLCFTSSYTFSQSNEGNKGKKSEFKTLVNHCSGMKAIYSDNVKTLKDNSFEFVGNVRIEDLGGPIPPAAGCGLFGNWVCGEAVIVSTSGDLTKIVCQGTTGKCAKIAKASVDK